MKELTLGDCLKQEEGTQGRLFDPKMRFGENHDYNTYRVIEMQKDTMIIEAYLLGGRKKIVRDIPIQERLNDPVMSSEDLLEWYRLVGTQITEINKGF